jgi:lysophospholipase L1-like esterase
LYSLYTTHESVEAIRLDQWQDLVRRGHEAEHLMWLENCRRRLPRTLRILRSGGALRLIGYGDSVTSLGGRHPDQTRFPNGPDRDHLGYFEQYGDDWKADQNQMGGHARHGVPHHQLGWNWQLKRTIEQRWPVKVEYLNWGLPGTTTGPDEISVEGDLRIPNGSNDLRVELMLRDEPDLVVVAFGTNDVGLGIDTRANLVRMVEAIGASGSEVIIVAPCPPNPGWGSRDSMLWLQTYDAVLGAAREADLAYVPTLEIFGSGREGAIGLSQRSYSAASMGNHPGARELNAVGRLLSLIIP